MTISTGVVGLGVVFKVGDGGGTQIFTEVANVTDIKVGGRTVEEIDFTHLSSTGGYKEFRPGFKDAGTISFNMHFDPVHVTQNGSARGIEGLLNSGAVFDFKIDFANTGKNKMFTGSGFIKTDDIDVSATNPLTAAVTVRITGPLALVDSA